MASYSNPTIPSGVDIFREIGMGTYQPQAIQSAAQDEVAALIAKGDIPSLQKAQTLINSRIQQRVATVAPQRPQPPRLTPVGGPTMQPTPAPAPAPMPAQTPQPAAPKPAAQAQTPQAPAPAAQNDAYSSNVLADITKLVKAITPLVRGGNPAPASAEPIISKPVEALPGRPTM